MQWFGARLGDPRARRKDTRLRRRTGGAILRRVSLVQKESDPMLFAVLALALQTAPTPAPAAPPAPVVEPGAEDETEFFTVFDTDKDGTISKAEFDAMSAKIDAEAARQDPSQKGQAAAGLATAFALMDQNKDGKITREEYRNVVQAGR